MPFSTLVWKWINSITFAPMQYNLSRRQKWALIIELLCDYKYKTVTLFSMYSSHCRPRLVTIRGVPSSTGKISILNFCGAAVTTWNKGYYLTCTHNVSLPDWYKSCFMYFHSSNCLSFTSNAHFNIHSIPDQTYLNSNVKSNFLKCWVMVL